MNKQTTSPVRPATEPQWAEEWVPLHEVIKHPPLQARKKLDDRAVLRYANMTKDGIVPPPIKLARTNGKLYLLDGWHRMEAGALQLKSQADGHFNLQVNVLVVVASMPFELMYWEAAKANVGNGVQYKAAEYLPVFKAFIKSKQHHTARRTYMSYREIATALGLGVSYSTLRRWTEREFPSLFRAMGDEGGNQEGGCHQLEVITLEQQHSAEASKAVEALRQHAGALADPVNRWMLVEQLEVTAAHLRAKGVEAPAF